ncbi:rhamnan synthesis F family protein [Enterococcus sp. AZ109]|uniref:rhamnan synthesis F family protein n=1 Tax=Enterococcus sp. AZ109 TaxID=2774634 RepID=UPI003F1ED953
MNNIVSIIVTSYNHGQYIEECLRSIFSQTYKKIELLVIDDGSSDASDLIIKHTLHDSPFEVTEYLTQNNSGVCVTRNRGLEWATGEYLLFIDSDDYIDSDFVANLVEVAKTKSADIVYCDLADIDTQMIHMKAKPFDKITFLQGNYISNTSLIRRSIIGETRYDLQLNREFLEDYDFIMQLIFENGALPFYAKQNKLNYRVLDSSISRKDDHLSREYFYRIYLYILKKHILTYSDEVFQAIKNNDLILETRIAELINHLSDITDYVKELEDENKKLKEQNEQMYQMNQLVIQDKQLILNTASYRVGNMIIKPIKYAVVVAREPRLMKKVIKKGTSFLLKCLKKIPKPQKLVLKQLRAVRRNQNEYNNPKRYLIYVIYEEQKHLQEYKLLFLNALKELSTEVLIVVNGELPSEDIGKLKNCGQVICRENQGYDAAAFRYGIRFTGADKLRQFDEILLVNDTNVGPMFDLANSFKEMAKRKLDFWGISYGEEQPDITGYNPYKFIPVHLQSYFLVIEKSMFDHQSFYKYWDELQDTDSRNKAVGLHETVFTKHFSDLGFKHDALVSNNEDSGIYIHPLRMLKEGVPLVKYSAFKNYNNDKFLWQGLDRKTEIPSLIQYIENNTTYPIRIVHEILQDIKSKEKEKYILIIDGVENKIPQCTRYRVLNKAEQLRSFGFNVKVVGISRFQLLDAEFASLIIIYRCGYSDILAELCRLAKQFDKTVLYDIDDLVIDTKYTDLLDYTKNLSKVEKGNYDANVDGYGRMLKLCDGAVTSTTKLQEELYDYQKTVLLNRNLASRELIEISRKSAKDYTLSSNKIKIGYFSGSITHNENFELVKGALIKLLNKYPQVELHLVGHLTLPDDLKNFKSQIITHDYVEWHELPKLISEVDINLAPLTNTVFNEAKSEIKWLEAALVKVPTAASNIGAFKEMIQDGQTGLVINDGDWFDRLEALVISDTKRQEIAESAYLYVMKHCVTSNKLDDLVGYVNENK